MKIDHVILIRTAHKESRCCVGDTQNQQKDLGQVKPISFTRRCVRFLPEPSERKETGNGHSQETPRDDFRWPSEDKNKLIGERPKCGCGYRQQQNIPRAGVGGSFTFRGAHGLHPGILRNSDPLQRLADVSAWQRLFTSHSLGLRKQVNCDQREQKVGNKHRRSGIIFCHSLPKKQRKDRNGGNDSAVECDR